MTDDSIKKRILARRARFVAAAMAGAGMMGCGSQASSCLSVVHDAGPDADAATDATDGGDADTGPQACLRPAPDGSTDATDTGPTPCLDPAPDSGEG